MPLVHDTALLQFEMPPFVCLRVRGISSTSKERTHTGSLWRAVDRKRVRTRYERGEFSGYWWTAWNHISFWPDLYWSARGAVHSGHLWETRKVGCTPALSFRRVRTSPQTISRSVLRWGRQAQPGLRKASTGAVGDCRGQSIHGRAGANLCPAHLFEQGHSSFRANRGQWILCAMVLSFGATGTQLMLWSPTLQDPGTQRPHVQYIAICWDDWPRLRYWSLADAPFHFFVLHCFLCLPHTHPQSPVIPIPPPQDLLRQAIGAERMSLYGVSYGTSVAGVYATVFPQHTHRVVMDGALHPAPDAAVRGESFAFASQSFWDGIVRDCEALHLVRAQIKGLLSFSKWFHVSLIS